MRTIEEKKQKVKSALDGETQAIYPSPSSVHNRLLLTCKLFAIIWTCHSTMSFLYFTENRLIPTEVRKEALELQKLLEFDDEGGEGELISIFMCLYQKSVLLKSALFIGFVS